jgi:hypothetical protein
LSTIDLSPATSRVVSLLDLALLSSLQPLEKIDLSQQQPLLLLPFAMQQVNLPSCTVVKEISVSVLQSLKDFRGFVIQCQ